MNFEKIKGREKSADRRTKGWNSVGLDPLKLSQKISFRGRYMMTCWYNFFGIGKRKGGNFEG